MYIPIYIPIKPMDLWILFDICFVSAGHLKLGLPIGGAPQTSANLKPRTQRSCDDGTC